MKPHVVLLALLLLVGLLLIGATACTSAPPVGGCWSAEDDDRLVAFFVDTDDGTVRGFELEDDGAVRIDFEGRWSDAGGGVRIEAGCASVTSTGVDATCSFRRDWAMSCSLEEADEEDLLRCAGAPFAEPTTLSRCQGNATVTTP